MITVYPMGTTIYKPDRCWNGYTLIPESIGDEKPLRLIDMNGNTVHVWPEGISSPPKADLPRAQLLKNGNVVRFSGKYRCPPEERPGGWIVELDWHGNLIRKLMPPKGQSAHHNFERLDNGHTFVVTFEDIPEECKMKIKDPLRKNLYFESDVILEFDENGRIVWEWHAYEYFDINMATLQDFYPYDYYSEYYRVNKIAETHRTDSGKFFCDDWTHVNTVRIIPENKWYDAGDERFRPGNVLICPRNFNRIYIVDKESKDIVWHYTGNFMGGLAHPHDPYMIPRGLPGAGNILIFDNGIGGTITMHCGRSVVLEINPVTKRVVWYYAPNNRFFSQFQGLAQRLANGNTLICETNTGRFFEVTPEKEIVWEYVDSQHGAWIQRYSYDWCPQFESLPVPKQIPVIPPRNEDFRITPAKGQKHTEVA